MMLVNTRVAPLDKPQVRQAINYAIDRRAMLDTTFGFGAIKSNPIPPKNWAFSSTAASYDVRDVTKAKQLLQEASSRVVFRSSSCTSPAGPSSPRLRSSSRPTWPTSVSR